MTWQMVVCEKYHNFFFTSFYDLSYRNSITINACRGDKMLDLMLRRRNHCFFLYASKIVFIETRMHLDCVLTDFFR